MPSPCSSLVQHRADAGDGGAQVEPGEHDGDADQPQPPSAGGRRRAGLRRCGSPVDGPPRRPAGPRDPPRRSARRPPRAYHAVHRRQAARHPSPDRPLHRQRHHGRDQDGAQVDPELGRSARQRRPGRPRASETAMAAAAGTVVTEMKTPTSAPLFDDVSDRTPAIPARPQPPATSWSGEVMNPVCGRAAGRAARVQPAHQPAGEGGQRGDADAHDEARPPAWSRPAGRPPGGGGRRRRPARRAWRTPGRAPSRPTVRIAESLMIAIPASSVAIVMNVT